MNLPPDVLFSLATGNEFWGTNWRLNVQRASDPSPIDQLTIVCDWDFGDGDTIHIEDCRNEGARVDHEYALPGLYTDSLSVTGTTSDWHRSCVNKYQQPPLMAPWHNSNSNLTSV